MKQASFSLVLIKPHFLQKNSDLSLIDILVELHLGHFFGRFILFLIKIIVNELL